MWAAPGHEKRRQCKQHQPVGGGVGDGDIGGPGDSSRFFSLALEVGQIHPGERSAERGFSTAQRRWIDHLSRQPGGQVAGQRRSTPFFNSGIEFAVVQRRGVAQRHLRTVCHGRGGKDNGQRTGIHAVRRLRAPQRRSGVRQPKRQYHGCGSDRMRGSHLEKNEIVDHDWMVLTIIRGNFVKLLPLESLTGCFYKAGHGA